MKMFTYEALSNVDRTKSVYLADVIIKNGWERKNYPVVQLDNIPWAFSDQQLRSWNFHIHCWDMLDNLFKAYSETNEISYLQSALSVVFNWIEKHSNMSQELSPFAWYDMSVGLRAYRLAYLYDAATRINLISDDEAQILWKSLEQHQAHLADDANIVFHNNHGFYQVAGQLAMGRRFADRSPLMAQAYEQGKQRLAVMLQTQFSTDGIHREHSPDYHRMVYDTLKSMIDFGLVTDPETIDFAKRIEEALSWFVLPNQHIANFGDSDYRLLSRKPAEAQRKWQTAAMQYVVSKGEVGELPKNVLQIFPEGGYSVVRKPSKSAPEDFSKFSYLAQTAAFHSRTHKHADDLSFIWSEFGNDILVDAGRYGYLGKAEQGSDLWLDGHWYSDPNRVYCESTRAHNTLEFDNKNYPRKGVKPYGSALSRWTRDASGVFAVETECKHFKSIRRVRVLVFMPGNWLLVMDWFKDNENNPHDVKQWFHLSPSLQLLMDRENYMVSVPSSPQPLRIVSLLPEPIPSRPHIGEEKPLMQGWWSSKERDIVPNYSFCYDLSQVETGVFATLFSFSNTLTADTEWSKTNISGRKGQFLWKDENGTHELHIERPADGEMIVEYKKR